MTDLFPIYEDTFQIVNKKVINIIDNYSNYPKGTSKN